MLDHHTENGGLGLDTETTDREYPMRDLVILWSLSDGKERLCLPSSLLSYFKEPLLENPEINFDLSNAKFDMHRLANCGVDISKAGQIRDTIVGSWLNNENNLGRNGLKETTYDFFGRKTRDFTDVFGKIPPKKKGVKLTAGDLIHATLADPVRRWDAIDYASLDAYNSTMCRKRLDDLLEAQPIGPNQTLKSHFYDVEVPFTKVLWQCERRGITVDAGHFKRHAPRMKMELARIEREFAHAAGKVVNLRSPPQIREFFYGVLGKPVVKMTDGGAKGVKLPSTDEEVLEGWAAAGDPYANMLLTHRSLAKTHDTYVEGLPEFMDNWYRIHTTLNQGLAVTGRLSSKKPNLQNIPRAEEDDFKLRDAFIAAFMMKLYVADYEQLEMRLMAHFAEKDLPPEQQKMCNAIRAGIDLHCLSVHEMYGIPYDDVVAAKKAAGQAKKGKLGRPLTDQEKDYVLKRQQCKAAGFGIIYGIGGELLAANLTRESKGAVVITAEEGKLLIKKWLDIFPSVRAFIANTKAYIERYGYVQTILGRFRRFGDIKALSRNDRAMAERQAVNAIVQGSAADIAKTVMITAENDPVLRQLGAKMLLQIHDEVIWEAPMDEATDKAMKIRIKEIMEHPFTVELAVPLPVEVGSGFSWSSAK